VSRVPRKGWDAAIYSFHRPLAVESSEERCAIGRLNHEPAIRSKGLVGVPLVSPFIFLLSFLARSIPLAELRQHSAQARESLSSVAVGTVADGDCTFQNTKPLLNDLVEGVQILWRVGKELGQCLEVRFDFSALGLCQASFFVEGSQYSGGHKFEGVKFLPELSRLVETVLFAFGLACAVCFVVGKENGNTLVESFKYPSLAGKL